MISNFAESLHYEFKEKIDVTIWEPGAIKTNILSNIDIGDNAPPDWQFLSSESSVKGALLQLGKER